MTRWDEYHTVIIFRTHCTHILHLNCAKTRSVRAARRGRRCSKANNEIERRTRVIIITITVSMEKAEYVSRSLLAETAARLNWMHFVWMSVWVTRQAARGRPQLRPMYNVVSIDFVFKRGLLFEGLQRKSPSRWSPFQCFHADDYKQSCQIDLQQVTGSFQLQWVRTTFYFCDTLFM